MHGLDDTDVSKEEDQFINTLDKVMPVTAGVHRVIFKLVCTWVDLKMRIKCSRYCVQMSCRSS